MTRVWTAIGVLVLTVSSLQAQTPQGSAFTYQGRLTDAGSPATGPYDLRFSILDAPVGGAPVGATSTLDDVAVGAGLFTVNLDFGSAPFQGSARWLAVEARPGASTGAFTPVGPRQRLTPAPSAIFGASAPWTGILGKPAGFADDVDNDSGGDITAVTAGNGLTGGATTGDAALAVSFGGSGAAISVSRTDHDHLGQTWTGSTGSGLGIVTSGFTAFSSETSSSSGRGVFGLASAASGASSGVHGQSTSSAGRGVFGQASSSVGASIGVEGTTSSPGGTGVEGHANNTAGIGVRGLALSPTGTGTGVEGVSGGLGPGVHGRTNGTAGVAGVLGQTSGSGAGVEGRASSNALSSGVLGLSNGAGAGVLARATANAGQALFAEATAAVGVTEGVRAEVLSPDGTGVWGRNLATSGLARGVRGTTSSNDGRGVSGAVFTGGPNTGIGVYGENASTTGWAGWFQGDVNVTGTVTRPAEELEIDHPLDPENRALRHASVGSDEMKNVYDGVAVTDASGYATVALPDWFEALNHDFRYQLTVVDEADSAGFVQAKVVKTVANNRFTLRSSAPRARVSWQVTGVRRDAYAETHPLTVDAEKPERDRGTYLHPEAWGQPHEKGRAARRWPDDNRNR